MYFRDLGAHLELWIPYPELSEESFWGEVFNSVDLEYAFYNAVAFIVILWWSKLLCKL